MGRSRPSVRILFLHANHPGLTPEYKVHTALAGSALGKGLEPYFVWQPPVSATSPYLKTFLPEQFAKCDFGREPIEYLRFRKMRRAGRMFRRLPRGLVALRSEIEKLRPDLIYTSQQSLDVQLAHLMSRLYRIPHVIHLHYSVGPWLGIRTLRIIRRCQTIIAVSEFVRQTALLRGIPTDHVRTVVNPLPSPLRDPPSELSSQQLNAELGLEEDTPVVVAVGRLDPGKGHLDLFSAFKSVLATLPCARLLICGTSTPPTDYESVLRRHVRELNLESSIMFLGYRTDVPAILDRANVFCLPTQLEPFGLVFLEAMEAGKPVVAYTSGGVSEIVVHGQTGLLSYPQDIEALSENILTLLTNRDLAECLGRAGRQRLADHYLPDNIVERWLDVLNRFSSR